MAFSFRSFSRLLALIAVACPLLASAAFAADLKVTWEVVQPFRFFRFPSDQAVQEWAWREVHDAGVPADRIVSEMEKKLNSVSWWAGKPTGSNKSRREMLDDLRRLEAEKLHRPFVAFNPRLGWASALRSEVGTSASAGTCWNQEAKSHRGCLSDVGQMSGGNSNDYVMPKRHMVKLAVWEKTTTGWKEYQGGCSYKLDVPPKAGFGFVDDPIKPQPEQREVVRRDCATPIYLRTEYRTSYPVTVTVPGTDTQLDVEVAVRDLLVVGIGDSFASGEGNPEIPAVLDDTKGVSPYIAASDQVENDPVPEMIIPTRKKAPDGRIERFTAARWLDDQCHRSMYSAQARTAIALSFEGERHHAITYVSFACSGAEITDGLFWPQDHRECVSSSSAGARLYQPQVSAVVDALSSAPIRRTPFGMRLDASDRYYRDVVMPARRGGPPEFAKQNGLCASWPSGLSMANPPSLRTGSLDRKIDLLLVSIGGNDAGFGPLVSRAVINSSFLNRNIPIATFKAIRLYQKAAGAIGMAEARRRIGTLASRFALLQWAFAQKFEISDPSRIVVSAYPRLSKKHTGFCGRGNRGMNVSTIFSTIETGSGDAVTAQRADEIVSELNGKIAEISYRYGWRMASGHVDRFVGHSFCDTDGNATGLASKIEALDIPHKRMSESASSWAPFNPATEFYPYESRKRWVRTFNDAYLLSNYFKGFATDQVPVNSDPGVYQAQRALGGPMHPTAQGHANMADGILVEARKALFVGGLPR